MKKLSFLLAAFALVALCLFLLPTEAQAATSGTCGKNLTWTLDDEGTLTISGTGAMWNYTWGHSPWHMRSSIKNIIIEDGVTTIGNYAIYNCIGLTSLTIPDSVATIGDYAFYSCSGLTSVTIGDGVTTIGNYAFNDCSSLNYNIYNDAKYLGSSNNPYLVLVDTTSDDITSCNIHIDTKIIGNYAFNDCASLINVTIPDSVTTIGDYVFNGCTSLTSITIPDSVTTIGDYAFYNCDSLSSFTIGNGVTSIGHYAFNNCERLTSVTVPPSVTSIGVDAFRYCDKLSSVYISDIAAWCSISFDYDSNGSMTWGEANPLKSWGKLYLNGELVKDLVIPDGVTRIGSFAFHNYKQLTSITFPGSTPSFGFLALSGCSNLSSIYISDLAAWCEKGMNDWDNNFKLYLNGELIEDLVIPDGVTTIGSYAFDNCTSLTSVTIPDSVTTIGSYSFDNCTSLTSVTIPDSVTTIGDGAFYNCTSLTSIVIPKGMDRIYANAFSGCSELTMVYHKGSQADWDWIIIESGNDYLKNATIIHDYTGCDHTWGEGVVTKAATCKATGTKTYTCTLCGGTKTETIPKLTTHTYDAGVVTKAASCKEAGIKTFTCSICGGTKTETIAKLTTHSYDNGVETKAPTCKETGVKTFTCTVCGDSYTEELAKLTDHSYDSGVVTKEATCGEKGVKTFTCTVCSDSYTEEIEKLTTHSYADGACTVCGGSDPDYVPPVDNPDPSDPTDPSEPAEPTEPTEPEPPASENFLLAIINAIIAFLKLLFGIQ